MKKLFSTLMLVLVALTVQAQILELLKKLTKEKGTSVIMITHDLGVVACDKPLPREGFRVGSGLQTRRNAVETTCESEKRKRE